METCERELDECRQQLSESVQVAQLCADVCVLLLLLRVSRWHSSVLMYVSSYFS